MTPKERAWKLQQTISEDPDESPLKRIAHMEQAITAAIEEEREACAMIADEYRPGPHGLIVSDRIAKAIRARSQSKGD